MSDLLNILQISTQDIGSGGAEKIAWNLAHAYNDLGHTSNLAVGYKLSDAQNVKAIPIKRTTNNILTRIINKLNDYLGVEDFNHPDSHNVMNVFSIDPDIIHCHNLHGKYFDLRYLSELSIIKPVILTLHDTWMLSGHCAYFLECERWKTGCGKCPDLSIYPPINKDATKYNWMRKRTIYSKSRLFIATPSQWLMNQVDNSILKPSIVDAKVINNGIDLDVFKPADKDNAKNMLGISSDTFVLLFAANGIRNNKFKDYKTLRSAVEIVSNSMNVGKILFIALGDVAHEEMIGKAIIRFIPFENNPHKVSEYYQASDIYLHAARADTFPTTILEAMACGIPVVATNVGGIPEQVDDGITGYLSPMGDADQMAKNIMYLLNNDELRNQFGIAARKKAIEHYNIKDQVDKYIEWYREIINKEQ